MAKNLLIWTILAVSFFAISNSYAWIGGTGGSTFTSDGITSVMETYYSDAVNVTVYEGAGGGGGVMSGSLQIVTFDPITNLPTITLKDNGVPFAEVQIIEPQHPAVVEIRDMSGTLLETIAITDRINFFSAPYTITSNNCTTFWQTPLLQYIYGATDSFPSALVVKYPSMSSMGPCKQIAYVL